VVVQGGQGIDNGEYECMNMLCEESAQGISKNIGVILADRLSVALAR
jgi:hypothetical protein